MGDQHVMTRELWHQTITSQCAVGGSYPAGMVPFLMRSHSLIPVWNHGHGPIPVWCHGSLVIVWCHSSLVDQGTVAPDRNGTMTVVPDWNETVGPHQEWDHSSRIGTSYSTLRCDQQDWWMGPVTDQSPVTRAHIRTTPAGLGQDHTSRTGAGPRGQ